VFAAVPEGPTTFHANLSSARKASTNTTNTSAYAGNVTELYFVSSSVTQTWQGYYGNVSGTISLEDGAGNKMYDWAIANPRGEVYATEGLDIPQWGNTNSTQTIECWNYTDGYTGTANENELWIGEAEGWGAAGVSNSENSWLRKPTTGYGIKPDAPDNLNKTFTRASTRGFPSFYVGDTFINGTSNVMECPSVALYTGAEESIYYTSGDADPSPVTGVNPGGSYQEVILYDTTTKYLIYTAIVDFERNTTGFNDEIWDFQMIVPDDGHGGDTEVTEYNFYLELE